MLYCLYLLAFATSVEESNRYWILHILWNLMRKASLNSSINLPNKFLKRKVNIEADDWGNMDDSKIPSAIHQSQFERWFFKIFSLFTPRSLKYVCVGKREHKIDTLKRNDAFNRISSMNCDEQWNLCDDVELMEKQKNQSPDFPVLQFNQTLYFRLLFHLPSFIGSRMVCGHINYYNDYILSLLNPQHHISIYFAINYVNYIDNCWRFIFGE